MFNSLMLRVLFIIFTLILIFFFGIKFFQEEKEISVEEKITFENEDTTTNVIKDVSYRSKDIKGNVYILNASEGRIDLTNSKIIFLTDVESKIIMTSGEVIDIQSDYGKYNIDNNDTIFSRNVFIDYTDNKIRGNYVDFSLKRNSLIISKNVVYSNKKSLLTADVVEIDIITKNAKIFMYEEEKKVKIKSN